LIADRAKPSAGRRKRTPHARHVRTSSRLVVYGIVPCPTKRSVAHRIDGRADPCPASGPILDVQRHSIGFQVLSTWPESTGARNSLAASAASSRRDQGASNSVARRENGRSQDRGGDGSRSGTGWVVLAWKVVMRASRRTSISKSHIWPIRRMSIKSFTLLASPPAYGRVRAWTFSASCWGSG